MALTAESTFAEVRAQYEANAAYDVNGSVAEAKLFVQACRIILVRRASRSGHGGEYLDYDMAALAKQLDKAVEWIGTVPEAEGGLEPDTRVTFGSFREYR